MSVAIEEFRPVAVQTRSGERVLFRSHLEAHWSHYFDRMGFKWVYEPFRLDIGGGLTYTPDFQVEGIGLIEIKPTEEHLADSWPRIGKFVHKTGEKVYAFCGGPAFILHGFPLQKIRLDSLAKSVILGGTQRRDAAREDPQAFIDGIEHTLKAAFAERIDGLPMTPDELDTVRRWTRAENELADAMRRFRNRKHREESSVHSV